MPVHYVLGNHDRLDTFNESSLSPGGAEFLGYYSFDCQGCHLVMLHTSGTGHGYGEMDDAQLAWLEQDLACSSDKPVLIFAHHPPFDVGVWPGWIASSCAMQTLSGGWWKRMHRTFSVSSWLTCISRLRAYIGEFSWPVAHQSAGSSAVMRMLPNLSCQMRNRAST